VIAIHVAMHVLQDHVAVKQDLAAHNHVLQLVNQDITTTTAAINSNLFFRYCKGIFPLQSSEKFSENHDKLCI
jgi:hypothetical protein